MRKTLAVLSLCLALVASALVFGGCRWILSPRKVVRHKPPCCKKVIRPYRPPAPGRVRPPAAAQPPAGDPAGPVGAPGPAGGAR